MTPVGSFRIVIVGGGISGITAAHFLAANGVKDVLVLESRGRLGGRIHTLQHEGAPVELGAQWIRGGCPANSLYNLANSLSLLGDEVQRLNDNSGSQDDLLHWPNTFGYIYRSNGTPLSEEATKQAYDIFNAIREEIRNYYSREYKTLRNNRVLKDKTRLLTFYNSRMRKAMENLRKDCHKYVADEVEDALSGFRNALSLVAGDDVEQCRLELVGACADLPGGDVVVPDGVVGILEALANQLPEGAVKLNRKVTLVDWSLLSRDPKVMDKVMLECVTPEGHVEEYYADFVISTLPIGVMKRFHQQIFYPGLDQQKIRAMQSIGCGHIAKLLLEWRRPWWAPGEGGLTLAWSNEEMRSRVLPRDWFMYISNFAEVEAQPNMLVCWIAGSGARVVDQLDEEEIVDRLTMVLHEFTGDPGLSRPSRLLRDTWSTDPDSLCSLTFPLLTTEEADFETMASPLPSEADPRLLFAGEVTTAKYFSTLHGARLSGIREARRVLERLSAVDKMVTEIGKISGQHQNHFN